VIQWFVAISQAIDIAGNLQSIQDKFMFFAWSSHLLHLTNVIVRSLPCSQYNKEENKVHYLEFPNFGRREFLGSLAELIMHALPSYHWKFHAHG
jgi:hypothetical protein